jgi:hypothetical protein
MRRPGAPRHAGGVARDISIKLDRCRYCSRPGFVVWDTDVFTCGREVCKALAFAEVRRRNRDRTELPEKRLARALLAAFDTFDYAVRLDEHDELLTEREAAAIRTRERERTAHLLAQLRDLSRRYPPLPGETSPSRRRTRTPRGAPASAPPARRQAVRAARGTASS